MHKKNSFITLTYNKENLPKLGSLDVRHWQLFAKKLRNRLGPFRFFHCGEYGDQNFRPHYHACIFGHDFTSDRVLWKRTKSGPLYESKILEEVWGKGFCTVGHLSYESANYVARYVMKKITGRNAEEHYERPHPETGEMYQLKPEYITMSRRPGLGSSWFDKYRDDVFPADEIIHQGRRFRPPRFYDGKLEEEELQGIQYKRIRAVGKRKEDLTADRLEVREIVAEARGRMKKRSNV